MSRKKRDFPFVMASHMTRRDRECGNLIISRFIIPRAECFFLTSDRMLVRFLIDGQIRHKGRCAT